MIAKVLVTCPPMLGMIDELVPHFERHGIKVTAPKVVQTLTEEELKELVPQHDAWIIGDDPATREVFKAGVAGRLKAVVKWGIGTDNVDFKACEEFGLPVTNTPAMFGAEVADIAVGYVIALARETFLIDREIRKGAWPKPRGMSLAGKKVALVGFGDIGANVARRLIAMEMQVTAYDPKAVAPDDLQCIQRATWPEGVAEADFIVLTCALTPSSYHMLNTSVLMQAKQGVRIVNVARGGVIDQIALETALASGKVHSAALDVFEIEPVPMDSPLRSHPRCILGSHNASNTSEAVLRASYQAMDKLFSFLGIS